MIKWDLHMHSHHSGDSKAKLQDMILSAKQKGLDGICITDHYDYDFPDEPDLFLLDFSAYIRGAVIKPVPEVPVCRTEQIEISTAESYTAA